MGRASTNDASRREQRARRCLDERRPVGASLNLDGGGLRLDAHVSLLRDVVHAKLFSEAYAKALIDAKSGLAARLPRNWPLRRLYR